MAQPVANNQSSNVQQDSTFWTATQPGASRSQQIASGLSDIYGLGRSIYGVAGPLVSGIGGFGENPLRGILSVGATYNNLQRNFPSTFTGPQQSPTMENLNYYGGAVSQYSNIGLSGVNAYSQFRDRNYAGGLQSLADAYSGLGPKFGMSSVVPNSVNAGIAGVGLAQSLYQRNYLGAGVYGAQLYNTGVQGGLISGGGQVPEGLINGVGGVYNVYQGLKNNDYVQTGLGGLSIAGTLANNAETITGLISPSVTNLLSGGAAQTGGQVAAQTGGQVATQTGGQVAAQTGGQVAGQTGVQAGAEVGAQAGAQTGAQVTAQTTGQQVGAVIGEAAGALAAAYGVYSLGKLVINSGDLKTSDTALTTTSGAVSGAGVGAYAGSFFGPAGTVVGGVIGGVVGGAIGFTVGATASSKGTYQNIRDSYRENLLKDGKIDLFDKDYQGTLADGSTFDFGKDGDAMRLDTSNPLEARAASLGNILASAQGATGKGRVALATLFAKAAASNAKTDADVDKNIAFFANKFGIDKGSAQAVLNQLKVQDKLSDEQYDSYSKQLAASPLNASKDKEIRQLQPDEIERVRTIQNVQDNFQKDAETYAKKNADKIEAGKDFQVPGDPNTYQKDNDGKIIRTKESVDESVGFTLNPDTNPNSTSKGIGGGKGSFQQSRDIGRDFLKKTTILDEDYQGTLADGSKFDFGKDGKGLAKLDYKDEVTGRIIGKANLIAAAEGFTGKALQAMAMLYTAAAMSNAKGDEKIAAENIKHFAAQRKFNSKNVAERLARQYQNGEITREEYEAFENENNQTLGPSGVPRAPEVKAPGTGAKGTVQAASGASDVDKEVIHTILTDNVRTGPENFTPEQAASLARILGKPSATYNDLSRVKVV